MADRPTRTMDEMAMSFRAQLGTALWMAREACGLTQAQVAERIGAEPETISRFERGATAPSIVRLLELSEVLGVTLASLLNSASPRSVDQWESVRQTLAELPQSDQKLATSVIRAVVEVWKARQQPSPVGRRCAFPESNFEGG